MGKTSLLAAALGLALVLGGCSSQGEGQENLLASSLKSSISAIQTRRQSSGRKPVKQVTPQQLADTKEAALQINPELIGGSDFLRRAARRNDDTIGTVEVWRASDNALVYLRNGVLVGTRGLGHDIISSDAGGTVAALAATETRGAERRYFISDGDYSDTTVTLRCDIDNLGRGTTQVVNFNYPTVHMREICIGGAGDRVRITNDYWVQPGSGIVRKSRQWAGPLSGYFEIILLKN